MCLEISFSMLIAREAVMSTTGLSGIIDTIKAVGGFRPYTSNHRAVPCSRDKVINIDNNRQASFALVRPFRSLIDIELDR